MMEQSLGKLLTLRIRCTLMKLSDFECVRLTDTDMEHVWHLYGRAGTKYMKQATDFECVRLNEIWNPCDRGTRMIGQVYPYETHMIPSD